MASVLLTCVRVSHLSKSEPTYPLAAGGRGVDAMDRTSLKVADFGAA